MRAKSHWFGKACPLAEHQLVMLNCFSSLVFIKHSWMIGEAMAVHTSAHTSIFFMGLPVVWCHFFPCIVHIKKFLLTVYYGGSHLIPIILVVRQM